MYNIPIANIQSLDDRTLSARARAVENGSVSGVDLATMADELISEAVKIGDAEPRLTPRHGDRLLMRTARMWAAASSGARVDFAKVADELVTEAVRIGASDLHVTPFSDRVLIRIRVDGTMLDVLELPVPSGMQLIHHFKVMAGMDSSRMFKPNDARQTRRVDGHEVDLRLACAPCVAGENLAIRLLSKQRLKRTVKDLGLSEDERVPIEKWLAGSSGMLLATGPTGSGKTTTLCALLHELKLTDRRVVTIEDPVEYQIDGVSQMQVDERHGLTFAEGLRAMLRLDADYLLLGEIRDAETAQVALEASTSGRVLMSTLHSRDPFGAVTALRNWGMADHEIATCLSMVISQRLVRKLCPYCRRRGAPSEATAQWLTMLGLPVPKNTWHPAGCPECHSIGYTGRTGVFEVWSLDEEAYQLILDHTNERTLRSTTVAKGHRPMLLDGISLAAQGLISFDELRSLGNFYLPPPDTPAANSLQQTLSERSANVTFPADGILFNAAPAPGLTPGVASPTLVF